MGRSGRIGILLIALAVLAAIGAVTLPTHLDDGSDRDREQCSFLFLANDAGAVGEDDRVTPTPYDDLDQQRRALFDRWLGEDSRTMSINATEWRALYNGSRGSTYVTYDGRLYRTAVSFNRCELWEALAASE